MILILTGRIKYAFHLRVLEIAMRPTLTLTAILTFCFAFSAAAKGDINAGEREYKRDKASHAIIIDRGADFLKGRKTEPIFGQLSTRQEGTIEEFKNSKVMAAFGETSNVWTKYNFVRWMTDPSKYLSKTLGKETQSIMTIKVKKEQDARDLWAQLNPFE